MAEGLYIYHEGHEQEHQQVMRELKEAADMIVNVNSRLKTLHDGLKGAGFAGQAQGMREWASLAGEATNSMNGLTEALRKNAEAAKEAGKGVGNWIRDAGEAAEAGKNLTDMLRQSKSAFGGLATFLYKTGGSIKAFGGLTAGLGTVGSKLGVGIRALSMATGGWGIVIQGVVTGLALFGDRIFGTGEKAEEAARKNKEFADSLKRIDDEARESAQKEIARANLLKGVIDNETASREKKLEAAGEMQSLYPEILGNYSKEEIAAGKAKDAIDKLTKSILKKAVADAAAKKYAQAYINTSNKAQALKKAKKELEAAERNHEEESNNSFVDIETGQSDIAGATHRLSQAKTAVNRARKEYYPAKDKMDYLEKFAKKTYEEVHSHLSSSRETKNVNYTGFANSIESNKHPLPKLTMIEPNLEEDLKNLDEAYSKLHATKEKLTPQQQEILNLQQAEIQKLVWLEDSYKNGLITLEEYNLQKQQIGLQATTQILEAHAKEIEQQLELNTSQEEQIELLNKLYGILGKINEIKKQNGNAEVTAEKDKQEQLNETISIIREYQRVIEEVANFTQAQSDRRISDIKAQEEAIDRETELQIYNIKKTAATDEEYRVRAAEIEEAAFRKKDDLRVEEMKEKRRQAKMERDIAITMAIVNTAVAVTQNLTKLPLALAAAALGAVQIATIMATPLPQYFTGTDATPKDGPAWVGEKGTEAIITPGGQLSFTPGKATLAYLPKGTQVIPHEETKALVAMSSSLGMSPGYMAMLLQQQNGGGKMSNKEIVAGLKDVKQAIANKQENHWSWKNGELRQAVKRGNSWTVYISKNIFD